MKCEDVMTCKFDDNSLDSQAFVCRVGLRLPLGSSGYHYICHMKLTKKILQLLSNHKKNILFTCMKLH